MKNFFLTFILLIIFCNDSLSQNKNNLIPVDSIPPLASKQYFGKFTGDEFIYGQVDEMAGNFMITVYSPEDSVIGIFNSTSEGIEKFNFNSNVEGNYVFEIKNLRGDTQKFNIKSVEKEPIPKNIEGKIDQIMRIYPDEGPGAVIGVTQNGKLIFSKGYGMANLEYDIPNAPNTVYYIASVSKQFTAFVAALLMDQGKLSLNDPINKYIPELNYEEVITIRDLIYHTNGLPGVTSLFKIKNGENNVLFTNQEAENIITRQAVLNHPPGNKFEYSNGGYLLLAMAIERITGQPFDALMEEKVFKPLNMNSTFVGVDHEKIIKNRADHYWPLADGGLRKIIAPITLYGSTGIYSTVGDLAKWLDNFKNPVVGNRNVINQMYELGYFQNGDTLNYAFGLDVLNFKGNKLIGHGGDLDSYHTYLGFLPDKDLGVIVLSNWYKATPCDDALKILDEWLPKKNENSIQQSKLSPDISMYEGSYVADGGLQFQLYFIKGDLYAQFFGRGPIKKLKRLSGLEFSGITPFCSDYKIHFAKEKKDIDIEGELEMYGKSSFKRISSPSETVWKPGKNELQLYEGEFYNADLKTGFTIKLIENDLIARNENHDKIILTPTGKDVFSGNRWYLNNIIFTRSDKGNVNTMLVSGFRIKDIPFERK